MESLPTLWMTVNVVSDLCETVYVNPDDKHWKLVSCTDHVENVVKSHSCNYHDVDNLKCSVLDHEYWKEGLGCLLNIYDLGLSYEKESLDHVVCWELVKVVYGLQALEHQKKSYMR
jgi:hypothetical protein